jgi:hypothetical protein
MLSSASTPPPNEGDLGAITSSELLLLGFGLLITILMVLGLVVLIVKSARNGKDS